MKNLFLPFLVLCICFSTQFVDADVSQESFSFLKSNSEASLSAGANTKISLSAEEISSYLKQSLEKSRKAREIEQEIANHIKNNPLKIAYTLFYDHEKGSACYVEAFGREDIVPDFAEPAPYELADLSQRPNFPRCSQEKEDLIRSYRDHSYLYSVDTAGWPVVAPAVICVFVAGANYSYFKNAFFKQKEKDLSSLLRRAIVFGRVDTSVLENENISDEELGAYIRSAIEKESQALEEKRESDSGFFRSIMVALGFSTLTYLLHILISGTISLPQYLSYFAPVCAVAGASFSIIHVGSSGIVNDIDRVEPLSP